MAYPPYYGAAVGYQMPHARPEASPRSYTAAARTTQLTGAGLGRLGALGFGAQQLAGTLGSAAGGGGIGYVASGDKEGILRGALMGVGLSMLGETIASARVGAVASAALTGVLTVASGGYAIWRMQKKRRWT